MTPLELFEPFQNSFAIFHQPNNTEKWNFKSTLVAVVISVIRNVIYGWDIPRVAFMFYNSIFNSCLTKVDRIRVFDIYSFFYRRRITLRPPTKLFGMVTYKNIKWFIIERNVGSTTTLR